jgi:hypothetical protein
MCCDIEEWMRDVTSGYGTKADLLPSSAIDAFATNSCDELVLSGPAAYATLRGDAPGAARPAVA